ncbi:hypothetical protein EZS27_032806 [termite gut metagenome]|uniref:Helix-turn-helix domain-containing protein n=1 Tax=termite gut metagenome TaxID=433724 RepID=A0A5J4Q5Q4_9ZZZZ
MNLAILFILPPDICSIKSSNNRLKQHIMYVDGSDFEKWMERLSQKLNEIGKDLKSMINTTEVLEKDEKLLDNQDLVFLFKISYRSLQRYRTSGVLPYFMIGHKTYYRASDVREFIRRNFDNGTLRNFEGQL